MMRSFIKKISGIVFAFILAFVFCTSNITAANENWSLYYSKGNPNYNKTSCHVSRTTTKTRTTIHVNNVGGGAEIFLYSTNGISSLKRGQGGDYVTTKKGMSVYMSVNYTDYGSSASSPSGYYDY